MIPVKPQQEAVLDASPDHHQHYGVGELTSFVKLSVNRAVAAGDTPDSERGLSGDALTAAVAARKEVAIDNLQDAQFFLTLIQRGITAMFSEATKPA